MIRRRTHTSMREYVIAGALSVVVLGLLVQVWSIARKEEIARHAADDAKHQLEALTRQQVALSANLTELDTERGKEATLRETYGVAKPGEEVIIVVPPEDVAATSTTSWWQKLIGFFKF